eukprot:TRINITY_DN5132_c0_g1_i4.p1 TRINITY_DN5132_c0_g1~~TRINITY_DN5132_c0_g1_i4.p1  ORF type:complete len:728 (-),score=130.50 TRINITY_DN5132_c0_g1_i4:39-2180(-)
MGSHSELREALLTSPSSKDDVYVEMREGVSHPDNISLNPNAFLETHNDSRTQSIPHLDQFLTRVYAYFLGKGFYPILLGRILNLFALLFIMFFSTLVLAWIDWSLVFSGNKLGPAISLSRPVHPILVACLAVAAILWLWLTIQTVIETKVNLDIRHFYRTTLKIPDSDMDTIQWREIVAQLIKVPRLCVAKEQLTPLDIANRIMRKENYFIALLNKDVLSLKMPFSCRANQKEEQNRVITRTLEWTLNYVIFNYVLSNHHDSVKSSILSARTNPSVRQELIIGLQRRFVLVGLACFFMSPFVFVFLLVYIFYRYAEEIRYRPGTLLGAREWTPYARWQFREFNEPVHVFQRRLASSYLPASQYMANHQNPVVTVIARFASFIIGAVLAVMVIASLWNEDALLNVEVIADKSTIWFVGVLGSLLAVLRSLIPEENEVFDPTSVMQDVVTYTHYLPSSWSGRLHSRQVFEDMSMLFEYRVVVFLRELTSVITAPLVLMFTLPRCAAGIVDFFVQFTVDVEGVGHVCSFATFNLEAHGNTKYGAPDMSMVASAPEAVADSVSSVSSVPSVSSARGSTSASRGAPSKHDRTKQGKMERSMLSFMVQHPEWVTAEGEALAGNLNSFVNMRGSVAPETLMSQSAMPESSVFSRPQHPSMWPVNVRSPTFASPPFPSFVQSPTPPPSDPVFAMSAYHQAHQLYNSTTRNSRATGNPYDFV